MWEKKKEVEEIKAILDQGTEFEGKLIFTGSVRINGKFQGEIFGQGSLIVDKDAQVQANIAVKSIYISGNVQGNIEVNEKMNIHSTGKFSGDVHTPIFIMEEGAFFDGRSHMMAVAEKKNEVSEAI
ncbi:MAG: polymer-forming cytoskeletal protein [Syntrophaceae bacterium]|nr:polymer-forming cytoskeletal protein [Syntrophaceae bacterium]